jgi:hypothetical protein
MALTSTVPADTVLGRHHRVMARCCNERFKKVKSPKLMNSKLNLKIKLLLQIILGVLIMTCVSAAWVGATHLLKSTFQTVQIIQVTDPPVVSTSAPHALLPPAANGSSTTVATPTTDQVIEFLFQ